MTARDLVTAAMQEIGSIAAGEPVLEADAQVALTRFNSLLDLWQIERLTIYNVVRSVFSFVANQSVYALGPSTGAHWYFAVRPQWVDHLTVLTGTGESAFEMAVEMISDHDWAGVSMKAMTMTWPTKALYTPTVPDGTLEFWPVPTDATYDAVIYAPTPLGRVANLDTVLSLAPGYEEALRYNLAVRLAPVFGRTLEAAVATLAVEAKAQVKRANTVPALLRVDEALMEGGGSVSRAGFYSGDF